MQTSYPVPVKLLALWVSLPSLPISDAVKWTKDRTHLLISFLKSVKKRFFGTVKKKTIWQEFAEKYAFCTWKKASSKYKQLLKTYRRNKKRQKATGGGAPIEWEYFDAMDELLGVRL